MHVLVCYHLTFNQCIVPGNIFEGNFLFVALPQGSQIRQQNQDSPQQYHSFAFGSEKRTGQDNKKILVNKSKHDSFERKGAQDNWNKVV